MLNVHSQQLRSCRDGRSVILSTLFLGKPLRGRLPVLSTHPFAIILKNFGDQHLNCIDIQIVCVFFIENFRTGSLAIILYRPGWVSWSKMTGSCQEQFNECTEGVMLYEN